MIKSNGVWLHYVKAVNCDVMNSIGACLYGLVFLCFLISNNRFASCEMGWGSMIII